MALMGDSIDNIPGARDPNEKPAPGERRKPGIGDVGARQLIQQFGSAEEALEAAPRSEARELPRSAAKQCANSSLLSKQLATIHTDAPVELDLDALQLAGAGPRRPARTLCRAGLHFAAETCSPLDERSEKTDYAQLRPPRRAARISGRAPGRPTKSPSGSRSMPTKPTKQGYGTRVRAIEVSNRNGICARMRCQRLRKAKMTLWAHWREWLADAQAPENCSRSETVSNLLAALTPSAQSRCCVAGIRHATMLYSYLLRPTTANHAFRGRRSAPFESSRFPARPANTRIFCSALAPLLRAEVEKQGLRGCLREDRSAARAGPRRMERAGVRVDPQSARRHVQRRSRRKSPARKNASAKLAGSEFNINSPQQLAEVLFDKLNLAPPRRAARAKPRSTAADVLEELALAARTAQEKFSNTANSPS